LAVAFDGTAHVFVPVAMSSINWRLKILASSGVLLSAVLVPVTELVLVAS